MPPKIQELRINLIIREFFETWENLLLVYKIPRSSRIETQKKNFIEIKINQKYLDGGVKSLLMILLSFPRIQDIYDLHIECENIAVEILLPREYPARSNQIKVQINNSLAHPFQVNGSLYANYFSNLANILIQVVKLLLYDFEEIIFSYRENLINNTYNREVLNWYKKLNPFWIHERFLSEYRNERTNLI